MDWTNTKEDAAGIEHQMELRRLIEQNPWLATVLAGGTGAMQSVPGPLTPNQERYASNMRQHAPGTYRAGAYGFPAAVGAVGAGIGNPVMAGAGAAGLATSAARDPGLAELLKRFSP